MSASLVPSDTLQRMMETPSSGPYYHDRMSLHPKGPSGQQPQHPSIPQGLLHHPFHAQQVQQMQAQVQAHQSQQGHPQAHVQQSQDRGGASVSHVSLEALAGSATEKQQQSQLQGTPERPFDAKAGQKCPLPECKDLPPFTRPCEYKKHKDKHDRPYVCTFEGCPALGFTYKGGLIRHEKEVHKRNTKSGYRCSYLGCTRVNTFTRRENFVEHLKRIHKQQLTPAEIENLRPSREGSPDQGSSAANVPGGSNHHHMGAGGHPNGMGAAGAGDAMGANGMAPNPNATPGMHDSLEHPDLRARKRHRTDGAQGGAVGPNGVTTATSTQSTPNMIMPGSVVAGGSAPGGGNPNSSVAASMAAAAAADLAASDLKPSMTAAHAVQPHQHHQQPQHHHQQQHHPQHHHQQHPYGPNPSALSGPQAPQLSGDEIIIGRARYLEIVEEMQKLKAANRDLNSRLHMLEVQVSNWMGSGGGAQTGAQGQHQQQQQQQGPGQGQGQAGSGANGNGAGNGAGNGVKPM